MESESKVVFPDLSNVATSEDVSSKDIKKDGRTIYTATYLNWAKTAHLLRQHAPGWEAEAVFDKNDNLVHRAPNGSCYLLIRFVNQALNAATVPVPHAIMDGRNGSIHGDAVSSRDISDSFVRGMCKAAALRFGLAWEMWSKDDPMARPDDDAPPSTYEKPPADRSPLPKKRSTDDRSPPADRFDTLVALFKKEGIEQRAVEWWARNAGAASKSQLTHELVDELCGHLVTVRSDIQFAAALFEGYRASGSDPETEDWTERYCKQLDDCKTHKAVNDVKAAHIEWATVNGRPDAMPDIEGFAAQRIKELKNAQQDARAETQEG